MLYGFEDTETLDMWWFQMNRFKVKMSVRRRERGRRSVIWRAFRGLSAVHYSRGEHSVFVEQAFWLTASDQDTTGWVVYNEIEIDSLSLMLTTLETHVNSDALRVHPVVWSLQMKTHTTTFLHFRFLLWLAVVSVARVCFQVVFFLPIVCFSLAHKF